MAKTQMNIQIPTKTAIKVKIAAAGNKTTMSEWVEDAINKKLNNNGGDFI